MQKTNVFSVSQLNIYVRSLLESSDVLRDIYVCGEISNFVDHYRSGHLYMTLKDEGGAVKAVMFKSSAIHLKFKPQNGMRVICRGRASVYERDGTYQFYVSSMQPDGVGSLAVACEQLKQKLSAEGLFDEAHKKQLPKYPSKIALVTSETGAAIKDMINVLSRRYPIAEAILFPVQVQGESAATQIASALEVADKMGFDIIITGRGGGSAEDLWAFNDERLARVIFNMSTPVISAVGHEIDYTISDFVADLRAPTPSAAAELAVPDISQLSSALSSMRSNLYAMALNTVSKKRSELEILKNKPCMRSAEFYVDKRRMECDSALRSLCKVYSHYLLERKSEYNSLKASLRALSPMNTLIRGYEAVRKDGRYINSVKPLKSGDNVEIRFSDGTVRATITEKE